MPRVKKEFKSKEPITIRFKELSKGSKSIYLDIYVNGKRDYDFLKLYLKPERTKADREQNELVMRMAEKIKAERIKQIVMSGGNFKNVSNVLQEVLLLDFIQKVINEKLKEGKSEGTIKQNLAVIKWINKYCPQMKLKEINKEFAINFVLYLKNTELSEQSIKNYIVVLKSVCNRAVESGLIETNPFATKKINSMVKCQPKQREYLTFDELKKVSESKCGNQQVKQAFLFSCYSGLRYSDISKLRWCDLELGANGVMYANFIVKKTKKAQRLPLNQFALEQMPDKPDNGQNELIFKLPTICVIEKQVKILVRNANIDKHITFHCARHTFATLLVSNGENVYNVKELLGHNNVTTTQIYADIVAESLVKSVNVFDKLFNSESK